MYTVVYNTSWYQFTKHKKKTPKNLSHMLRRTHRIWHEIYRFMVPPIFVLYDTFVKTEA